MTEPGIVLIVNGEPRRWRGLALEFQPGRLPAYTVDIDGHVATRGTLEGALLSAARVAEASEPPRGRTRC